MTWNSFFVECTSETVETTPEIVVVHGEDKALNEPIIEESKDMVLLYDQSSMLGLLSLLTILT
jgi:hypothetical protein